MFGLFNSGQYRINSICNFYIRVMVFFFFWILDGFLHLLVSFWTFLFSFYILCHFNLFSLCQPFRSCWKNFKLKSFLGFPLLILFNINIFLVVADIRGISDIYIYIIDNENLNSNNIEENTRENMKDVGTRALYLIPFNKKKRYNTTQTKLNTNKKVIPIHTFLC